MNISPLHTHSKQKGPMKFAELGSALFCATAMVCSMSTAASAMNLVANGSFEEYNLNDRTWKLFRDGSQEQFGWSPTEGSNLEIFMQ